MLTYFLDIFDNNKGIQNNFTNYLEESCWYCSDKHFSFKPFLKFSFSRKI